MSDKPYPDHTGMRHYVYRFFDADGRLVYVGCTVNTEQRFYIHAKAWWAGQVDRIKIKVYPNKAVAREAEKEAIRTENPRWNIQGKWAYVADWSQQDFLDYFDAVEKSDVHIGSVRRERLERAKSVYRTRFGLAIAA